jgi:hypothetical protein
MCVHMPTVLHMTTPNASLHYLRLQHTNTMLSAAAAAAGSDTTKSGTAVQAWCTPIRR